MITIEMLLAKGACSEQVALFRKTFGDSAAVTLENCMKASSVGLFISWAAENLLSPPARETYGQAIAPAWEAYRRAIAPAWEAYRRATAAAQEAYRQAIAPMWEVYERDISAAWLAYKQAIAPAWGAYRRAEAAAFFAAAVEHAELGEK